MSGSPSSPPPQADPGPHGTVLDVRGIFDGFSAPGSGFHLIDAQSKWPGRIPTPQQRYYSAALETAADVTRRSQASTYGRTIPRSTVFRARSALNGVGFRRKPKSQRRSAGHRALLGAGLACRREVRRGWLECKGPRRLLPSPRPEKIRGWTNILSREGDLSNPPNPRL